MLYQRMGCCVCTPCREPGLPPPQPLCPPAGSGHPGFLWIFLKASSTLLPEGLCAGMLSPHPPTPSLMPVAGSRTDCSDSIVGPALSVLIHDSLLAGPLSPAHRPAPRASPAHRCVWRADSTRARVRLSVDTPSEGHTFAEQGPLS